MFLSAMSLQVSFVEVAVGAAADAAEVGAHSRVLVHLAVFVKVVQAAE